MRWRSKYSLWLFFLSLTALTTFCGSGLDILLDDIALVQNEAPPPDEITLDSALIPPQNVRASACRADGNIQISWNVSQVQDGALATFYFLYRFSNFVQKSSIPSDESTFTGLDANAMSVSVNADSLAVSARFGTANVSNCSKNSGVITCADTPPSTGNYSYRIRACDTAGVCSDYSVADLGSNTANQGAVANFASTHNSLTTLSPTTMQPTNVVHFNDGSNKFAILDSGLVNVRVYNTGSYTPTGLTLTELTGTPSSPISTQSSVPADVAASNNRLYVVYPGENVVREYLHTNYNTVNATFNDSSSLDGASSLYYAANGDLWVGDTGNHRAIKIPSANLGATISTRIGSFGSEPNQIAQLQALAAYFNSTPDPDIDHLYILDLASHKIKVFNGSTGDFIFSFGSKGNSDADFEFPTDIESHNGKVYVLDAGNGRVTRYDPLTGCAEARTAATTVLPSSGGLTVDRMNNRLLITDRTTRRLYRYNTF